MAELTIDQIQDRVAQTDDQMADYRAMAKDWEQMWRLQAFDQDSSQAAKEGREQLVFPDPFNSVNLALRLLSNRPNIDVPVEDVTHDKDESASKRKRFLSGLWHRSNREQRRNLVKDAAWCGLVRGRFVLDVRWVYNELPERQRRRRMPILIRTLDPLNCGFRNGPFGPLWAYHKYDTPRIEAQQRWPELGDKPVGPVGSRRMQHEEDEVEVTDFWWVDQDDGSVWNAVVIDDTFVKAPTQTDYPDLPMLEGVCDGAPINDQSVKGLGLMHAINGPWQYKCRLISQVATGMLWYFWPFFTVMNEMGYEVPDFDVEPGVTQHLPVGTIVDSVMPEPNIPLAQSLLELMEATVQQSTFPGVMYGEAPGQLQAGYGVSLLADAAKGRINSLRENLEWAMATTNEMALAMVEKFAPPEGIAVWGVDEGADELVHIQISREDIDGYHENYVRITPNVPDQDMQKQTMGLRMVQEGLISRRTYRTHYANMALPEDEEQRVLVEQALMSDEVRQMGMQKAMQQYFGPDWREIVGLPPEQPQQPQMPQPGMPPGQMPPGMPPGMPPQGPPMQGGPGGAGGPPPPQTPMQGNMQIPGGMAGFPAPPPNVQGGMMTPEQMGLPPDIPPELWQAYMGGQLQPADLEEIMRMGGMGG